MFQSQAFQNDGFQGERVLIGELSLSLSDNLNAWADFTPSTDLSYAVTASDSINNWADAIAIREGQNLSFSDSINNWADAFTKIGNGLLSFSDSINFWADLGFVVDYFTEATDTLLASHVGQIGGTWTAHASESTNVLTVDSATDRLYMAANGPSLFFASGIPRTPDYFVECDFFLYTAENANIGILARLDTAANTYYVLRLNTGTQWQLRKVVAGVATSLGTSNNQIPASGTSVRARLTVVGTSLIATINGVNEISTSDSDISAAGRAAVRASGSTTFNTGTHLDNFIAGDQLRSIIMGELLSFSDSINNWNDSASVVLASGPSLLLSVSDDLNNWADAFTKSGIGFLSFSDSLNNWLDASTQAIGKLISASDSINNWNDSLTLAIGRVVDASDSLNNWSDFTPTLQLDFEGTISDNLNAWADAYAQRAAGFLSFSDTLNNWADAYSQVGNGLLSFSDSLNNWTDACSLIGNGRVPCSDNLNAWADACVIQVGIPKVFSDSINNLADACSIRGAGLLPCSDSLNAWADSYSQSAAGFLTFSDNINNLLDFEQTALGKLLTASDSLNNWADAYTQQLLTGGIFLPFTDTLVFTDSIALREDYLLALADNLNAWNDSVIQALGATQLSLFDDLNNFADSINLSHVRDTDVTSDAAVTYVNHLDVGTTAAILGISTVVDLNIPSDASINLFGSTTVDSSAVIVRMRTIEVTTSASILAVPCFISLNERATFVVRGIAKLAEIL